MAAGSGGGDAGGDSAEEEVEKLSVVSCQLSVVSWPLANTGGLLMPLPDDQQPPEAQTPQLQNSPPQKGDSHPVIDRPAAFS